MSSKNEPLTLSNQVASKKDVETFKMSLHHDGVLPDSTPTALDQTRLHPTRPNWFGLS